MVSNTRPSLLVIAYACAPGIGSEHGAGWGVVTALSEFADLTILTGSRHIEEIQAWQKTNDSSSMRFVEVSDRRMGPRVRWHRIPEFLLYLLWQRKAKQTALSLMSTERFDAGVHATFSASWLPASVTSLGLPTVWGPVGGGVTTPRPLWSLLGRLGALQEILDMVSVRLMAYSPATRRSARRATKLLMQNDESLALLPKELHSRAQILNHALFSVVPESPRQADGRYVLWVSPMESRKGPRLIIEAMARTAEAIPLTMVGDGPQRTQLERLAQELGIGDRVTFTGLVDRSEVVRLMGAATTVAFTGLREEGGLALAEAMYSARRLIVLNHGGAGSIAKACNDPRRVALIQPSTIDVVASGFAAAIETHFAAEVVEDGPLLDRDDAISELRNAVESATEQQ